MHQHTTPISIPRRTPVDYFAVYMKVFNGPVGPLSAVMKHAYHAAFSHLLVTVLVYTFSPLPASGSQQEKHRSTEFNWWHHTLWRLTVLNLSVRTSYDSGIMIRLPYTKVYITYAERTTKHDRSDVQHPASVYGIPHVLIVRRVPCPRIHDQNVRQF
jgi:hypothetical protein